MLTVHSCASWLQSCGSPGQLAAHSCDRMICAILIIVKSSTRMPPYSKKTAMTLQCQQWCHYNQESWQWMLHWIWHLATSWQGCRKLSYKMEIEVGNDATSCPRGQQFKLTMMLQVVLQVNKSSWQWCPKLPRPQRKTHRNTEMRIEDAQKYRSTIWRSTEVRFAFKLA